MKSKLGLKANVSVTQIKLKQRHHNFQLTPVEASPKLKQGIPKLLSNFTGRRNQETGRAICIGPQGLR